MAKVNCAYCNSEVIGETQYAIHRDGFIWDDMEEPEVALCVECGSGPNPTCDEIWARIAKERRPDLFPEDATLAPCSHTMSPQALAQSRKPPSITSRGSSGTDDGAS
jgi:hypothetical protein